MRRRLLAAATAAVLPLFLVTASTIEAGKPKIYRIAGEGKDARGKVVPSDDLAFESAGISLSMRYLDGPARTSALSSVLGREVDLFPERSASSRGYLVFVFEIRSRAVGDLIFEPGQGRLITNKYDVEFPMDYSSLYELLSHQPAGSPSLEEVRKAVYSEATTIRPGGSIRKLLVFQGPKEDRWKTLQVRIGALHLTDGDVDTSFKFRKFEVEP